MEEVHGKFEIILGDFSSFVFFEYSCPVQMTVALRLVQRLWAVCGSDAGEVGGGEKEKDQE